MYEGYTQTAEKQAYAVGSNAVLSKESAPGELSELESLFVQLDQLIEYLFIDKSSLANALTPYLKPVQPQPTSDKMANTVEPVRSPVEAKIADVLRKLRVLDQDIIELRGRV